MSRLDKSSWLWKQSTLALFGVPWAAFRCSSVSVLLNLKKFKLLVFIERHAQRGSEGGYFFCKCTSGERFSIYEWNVCENEIKSVRSVWLPVITGLGLVSKNVHKSRSARVLCIVVLISIRFIYFLIQFLSSLAWNRWIVN